MANINISSNELEDAASYLIQYLRDKGFTGSTEVGTALYDVLITPDSILLKLISDMINRAKAYLSLEQAEALRSEIGEDEYNAAVDSILQNWFVTRKAGSKSTGTVRVYFSRSFPYFSLLKDGSSKFNINGVDYDVTRDYALAASNFTSVYNSDRNALEYYADFMVESLDNSVATNGDIITNINSIYFLRSVLVGNIVSGTLTETSEAFIARTGQVITTRELISDNAIYTTLAEVFDGIREIYVAGFGDTEQLRDVVSFADMDIHVGNKSDIYLNVALNPTSEYCAVDSNGILDLSQISNHIAGIKSVWHPLETEGYVTLHCVTRPTDIVSITHGVEITLLTNSSTLGRYFFKEDVTIDPSDWLPCYLPDTFGVYFEVKIVSSAFDTLEDVKMLDKGVEFIVPDSLPLVTDIFTAEEFYNRHLSFTVAVSDMFDMGTVGKQPICTITEFVGSITNCYIEYLTNSLYEDVLNFITDYDNRVVCYDPSIKSKYMIYITCDFTISTTGLSTETDIETERVNAVTAAKAYIDSLTKDEIFSVFDMLVAINSACPNIDRVKTPPIISYSFQDPASLIVYSGTITDYFSLDNIVLGEGEELSLMVSQNTFQYYSYVSATVDKAYY